MATNQQVPTVQWALPLQMAEYILNQLARAPYAEVAQTMAELQRQTQESLQAQQGKQAPALRAIEGGGGAPDAP
jgi:hypothetical protein